MFGQEWECQRGTRNGGISGKGHWQNVGKAQGYVQEIGKEIEKAGIIVPVSRRSGSE